MSDGNNQNNKDYIDLLKDYENKASKKTEKDEFSKLAKADFFKDYEEGSTDEKSRAVSGVSQKRKIGAPPIKENHKKITDKNSKFAVIEEKFNNLPRNKKIAVSVIAVFCAIVITFVCVAGIFVNYKLNLIGDNSDENNFTDDPIYNEQEFEDIEIDIGSSGFKQSLIDWATIGNDKHMSSKNVINVLLIGADSRKGKNEGNTDVMMLVSANRKTKQLKLVSFLRDSYLYIEDNSSSYCTKLNAAYSMGGPECLIKTIENNYKIDIDNYVMVNFESFKAIIDEMGGISVDVKEYEANYIENHYKTEMPSGENVLLDGKQALFFARVRKCDADGDVSRTRRQRQIIDSMVDRIINSSISEINKYIDIFLPYVDTGYSKSELVSLGIKAIAGGWAKYEREQISMPDEDSRISGSANMWIWVVDYQKAAHDLQMAIYGDSNIVLQDGRVSTIDIYRGANYSGSSDVVISDKNNNQAEVPETTENVTETTTVPQTTEETTQTVTENTTVAVSEEEEDTTGEETQPPEEELGTTEQVTQETTQTEEATQNPVEETSQDA